MAESTAGCTANVTLIADGNLICANAGDSRTLLCSKGKPFPLSVDHKPEDEGEYNRITKAGGNSSRFNNKFYKVSLAKEELMEI
jgi:serine/threonine protein phosphatase PrpC